METLLVIALTTLVTGCSIAFGYWLANYQRELSNDLWFADLTFEDFMSDTPIAHKLDRIYGYENKM